MKHRLFYALGLIVLLVMVAFVTSPAEAQTTAPGPYYATPAWDQKLACESYNNCPRFIVLSNWNNEAVLDRETGLVWQQAPGPEEVPGTTPTFDWYGAQARCNTIVIGGRLGWRLPTIQELASLFNPTPPMMSHFLPTGHPFNFHHPGECWSSTTVGATHAWSVNFHWGGGSLATPPTDTSLIVWCVRGGQGVGPQ